MSCTILHVCGHWLTFGSMTKEKGRSTMETPGNMEMDPMDRMDPSESDPEPAEPDLSPLDDFQKWISEIPDSGPVLSPAEWGEYATWLQEHIPSADGCVTRVHNLSPSWGADAGWRPVAKHSLVAKAKVFYLEPGRVMLSDAEIHSNDLTDLISFDIS